LRTVASASAARTAALSFRIISFGVPFGAHIYRKYYGLKMAAFLFGTFYISMAGAALIVEAVFAVLGLVPTQRTAQAVEASVTWSYTTWLNIVV
jgi:hypothetical protein